MSLTVPQRRPWTRVSVLFLVVCIRPHETLYLCITDRSARFATSDFVGACESMDAVPILENMANL